jgi:hypothetical protein
MSGSANVIASSTSAIKNLRTISTVSCDMVIRRRPGVSS